jgi:hypothetical protein
VTNRGAFSLFLYAMFLCAIDLFFRVFKKVDRNREGDPAPGLQIEVMHTGLLAFAGPDVRLHQGVRDLRSNAVLMVSEPPGSCIVALR